MEYYTYVYNQRFAKLVDIGFPIDHLPLDKDGKLYFTIKKTKYTIAYQIVKPEEAPNAIFFEPITGAYMDDTHFHIIVQRRHLLLPRNIPYSLRYIPNTLYEKYQSNFIMYYKDFFIALTEKESKILSVFLQELFQELPRTLEIAAYIPMNTVSK
jgi:hypothetical protein